MTGAVAAPDDLVTSGFTVTTQPMRVRFARGASRLVGDELDALGLARALVVCSPEQQPTAQAVSDALGARTAGLLPTATMHVPADVAADACDRAAAVRADCVVAVGGGSAIGLAKAVALQLGTPVVAVPTTYAGSEMTPVWGITRDGEKTTGRDPRVLPRSVVYDPDLTDGLPVAMSVTSGLNAVAHAVEALYAPDRSPITALMAEEGVRALVGALPSITRAPDDADARSRALYGAWLCGACLGATTMSLHHKLCHALGGTLDLPHAAVHAVVLPHALRYNEPGAPTAVAALRRALGTTDDPSDALFALADTLGAPQSLAELGMREADVDRIAAQVVARPYANPVPVTVDGVAALLRRAWAGLPPRP